MKKPITTSIAAAIFTMGFIVGAHAWTLNNDSSRISFGSVKKDVVGESHSFNKVSGSVSDSGEVSIEIDLASVQTNIDIRNERMLEHVFKGVATAKLSAELDMEEVNSLAVGDSTVTEIEGVLGFLGVEVEVEAEMFVVRIAENRVMATTNDLVYISTEDLGIDAGIDKLMELAKLPSITRTTPVSARLIFDN